MDVVVSLVLKYLGYRAIVEDRAVASGCHSAKVFFRGLLVLASVPAPLVREFGPPCALPLPPVDGCTRLVDQVSCRVLLSAVVPLQPLLRSGHSASVVEMLYEQAVAYDFYGVLQRIGLLPRLAEADTC